MPLIRRISQPLSDRWRRSCRLDSRRAHRRRRHAHEFITVAPEDTLGEVADRMVEEKKGGAVVVMDYGRMIGILTERDMLRAMAGRVHTSEARVREWMTEDPITVPPETTLDEASQLMLDKNFRHLPVVEGGRVVGVVSLRRAVAGDAERLGLTPAAGVPSGASDVRLVVRCDNAYLSMIPSATRGGDAMFTRLHRRPARPDGHGEVVAAWRCTPRTTSRRARSCSVTIVFCTSCYICW